MREKKFCCGYVGGPLNTTVRGTRKKKKNRRGRRGGIKNWVIAKRIITKKWTWTQGVRGVGGGGGGG